MAAETLGEVLRRIGRRAGLDGVLALTDAQLLERFAAGRDEPAFAALMVRHGPMVLGVCRRMLRDAGQAEDAFQAAFLVLARKAGAIQQRPLLGAWLYGVAYKVAARLRGRTWRRQAQEKPTDLDAMPAAAGPDSSDFLAIYEEVHRLPDKYRDPIVLCYLEGKTHEEAARLLDWPVGTVKGRLARARDLLRSRLARRGVGPSEGTWATALVGPSAPAALVDATVRAAPLFAAGDAMAGGLVSSRALALSQGVLRTMMLTNWKTGAALGLLAALLAGTGGYIYRTAAAEPGPAPKTAANADKPATADKAKEDKDAIQGAWQVTAVEMGGKEAPDNEETKRMKTAKWVISADKITITGPGQEEHNVSFKLDPRKKPKEIDVTPLDGPENEKGKLVPGVYALEGDALKICIPAPAHPDRPAEVVTKEGGDAMLLILKRLPPPEKPKGDKPKEDKEALLGAWQVTDFEVKGKGPDEATLKKIKGAKWVFTADKAVVQTPGEKDEPAFYKLDPSKAPKEIDFTPAEGEERDKPKGIYILDGDILKLCFAGPEGGPRPTEFAAKEGGKTVLLTLKRVKEDKDKPADKPKEDKDAILGTWQVTGLERDGKEWTEGDEARRFKSAKWVIAADKIDPGTGEPPSAYTLDPSKTPKELDVAPTNKGGQVRPAIYSLEGDVLKICMSWPPDPVKVRPNDLTTKEGSKTLLVTLKREGPNKDGK